MYTFVEKNVVSPYLNSVFTFLTYNKHSMTDNLSVKNALRSFKEEKWEVLYWEQISHHEFLLGSWIIKGSHKH